MGNCCGISSKEAQQNEPLPISQDAEFTMSTGRTNTPFIGTPDPIGLGAGSSSPSNEVSTAMTDVLVQDHRLQCLLEFFQQLRFRRKDIFKQIIPVHRQALEDIFDKMKIDQEKLKQLKSLGGVPLQRSRSSEDLKLARFKVKPIDSPNDKIKGGGSKPPAGSK